MTRIAVVNNDTMFLEMMGQVLKEQGWDTEVYREADTAFPALKRSQPDLIILDIRMQNPEDGWNLLELLTLDQATAPIPIIVCSAAIFDLRAHQDWLTEHGIAILPKPFDIDDLYQTVRTTLDKSKSR